jgi:hypothetical protein
VHENLDSIQPTFNQKGVHLVPLREIENGAYYDGEISNTTDKREGFGAQVWRTGALYVGEWKDDR